MRKVDFLLLWIPEPTESGNEIGQIKGGHKDVSYNDILYNNTT